MINIFMSNFTILDLFKTLGAIENQIHCNQNKLSMLDKNDPNLQDQITKLEEDISELTKDAVDYSSWIKKIPFKYPFD